MQTINLMPALAASNIASAAKGGGTKIDVAVAFVSFTASATVLNIGTPWKSCPPFPGV